MSDFGSKGWFRALTPSEYQEFVTHLQTQVVELHKALYTNSGAPSYQTDQKFLNIKGLFGALRELQFSNPASYRGAYKLLCVGVKKHFQFYSQYEQTALAQADLDRLDMWVRESHLKARELVRQNALQQKGSTRDPIQNFVKGSSVNSTDMSGVTSFPRVNREIEAVQSLLSLAKGSLTTPEDDYFLSQVSTAYLPMIVSGANGVKNAVKTVRVEAEQNFLTQLDLIEQRLRQVIEEAGKRTLTQVEHQTLFLSSKLIDVPQNPNLRLVWDKKNRKQA